MCIKISPVLTFLKVLTHVQKSNSLFNKNKEILIIFLESITLINNEHYDSHGRYKGNRYWEPISKVRDPIIVGTTT